ncbi:hypothetical protein E2I00_010982, partial [Balaenoptera physalus]
MALGRALAAALALSLAVLGPLSPGARAGDCKGQRQVLREAPGFVTDGAGNYSVNGNCEWLIEAPSSQYRILLDFLFLDTECTYDYLFVYDGDSPRGPLLASLSGSTRPPPVEASSGKMLLHLFSDANYNLLGFNASFRFSLCPGGCYSHGQCQPPGVCVCEPGWGGPDCGLQECPAYCGSHGTCASPLGPCLCEPGFLGRACDLHLWENQGAGWWHNVSAGDPAFSARIGAAGAFLSPPGLLAVFGGPETVHLSTGQDLNSALGDLVLYNFSANTWERWDLTPAPAARHSHVAVAWAGSLVLMGGELADGSLTSDVWAFSPLGGGHWELLAPAASSSSGPPGLAGHAAALVDSIWLYVSGGRTQHDLFSSGLFRFRLDSTSGGYWEQVIPAGGRPPAATGHSMVFHAPSRALLVHGGHRPSTARFSVRVNSTELFHVDRRVWTTLKGRDGLQGPRERAFHTASVLGHYMVVYGGNVHTHYQEEKCYEDGIFFYHLGCHQWVSGAELAPPGTPEDFDPLGQVPYTYRAYRSYHLDYCSMYTDHSVCSRDPECSWCQGACQAAPPPGTPSGACPAASCLGLGRLLGDCQACLAFSSTAAPPRGPGALGWCVHNESCLPRPEQARCRGEQISGTVGWWGPVPVFVTSLEACVTQSFLPGLHLLTFQQPPNASQPDKVLIVRSTTITLTPSSETDVSLVYRGFIHPLLPGGPGGPGAEDVAEEVGRWVAQQEKETRRLQRPGSARLFPLPGRGHKYAVEIRGQLNGSAGPGHSELTLLWDRTGVPGGSEISFFFLEPYRSSACTSYSSCLGCLADQGCGWCLASATCHLRQSGAHCGDRGAGGSLLVLVPALCPLCEEHRDCHACTQVPTRPQRLTCDDCLANSSQCAWCQSTHACFIFGNATGSGGCRPCQCNGHGDPRRGHCDNLSGLCFCQDHTEGAHCQLCSPGYYGDPRAGGSCFRECGGRALLTNVSSVALGSRRVGGLLPPGGGAARAGPGLSYCVWVVSATEVLQPCAPGTLCPPLTLTFSPDSSTPCTLSYVLAFDGFPRFLDTGVVQSDRLLVLHWEANGSSSWGFNASVGSARCGSGGPGSCPVPQECVPQDGAADAGLCRCPQGWAGPHCRMALCPENCNAHNGAGTCNQSLGVCICAEGFGGPDCATKLDGGQLVWETLMDSRLSADTASRFLHRLGHTMVEGPEATLWMFGGLGLPQGLLGNLYRLHEKLPTSCPVAVGLYGHSAVYHEATDSLYVFGGFRFHVELAAPSPELYSLHCPDRTWSLLAPSQGAKTIAFAIHKHIPKPFLGLDRKGDGTLLGDTMVVLGGRSDPDEFSSDVLLYQVNCNTWLLPDLIRPASVGPPMEESVAHAVAAVGGRLYISGGFGGVALGRLLALTLPLDPCHLLPSPEACNQSGACTWCHGACLSGDQAHRLGCGGPACSPMPHSPEECRRLRTCSECLARHPRTLQPGDGEWCTNCPEGACIGRNGSCTSENDCRINQREVFWAGNCSEAVCGAADCEQCTREGKCMWTRQFKRTGETRRILSVQPTYDWTCFSHSLLNVSPMPVESSPPLPCPTPCHLLPNCTSCLDSKGADGGWQHCVWSSSLQQVLTAPSGCLSPSYLPLRWLTCGRPGASWAFLSCPPEDDVTGLCRPVCAQGCVNGSCVEPDHCRCHFGFVGHNCSTECRCNRHSECAGVGARDHCLLCHNHTKGSHCEQCLPLFVGSAVGGGTCRPCHAFCRGNSQVCVSRKELEMARREPEKYSLDPDEVKEAGVLNSWIESWVTEGPSEDEAVCVNCQNNSYGDKCESCLHGYFLLDGKCTKCQCNGHADTCNEQDGTGCPCQNNTETGTCQGSSPSDRRDCYKYQVRLEKQCAKCRESFHGSPLGGQQCYRLISVEQEYCLDPTSQTNCFHEPKRRALGPGRTVLFGVQPKFTNVDIRLTLDVTFGAVDLYVSTSYDTFVVRVAPDTGVHTAKQALDQRQEQRRHLQEMTKMASRPFA